MQRSEATQALLDTAVALAVRGDFSQARTIAVSTAALAEDPEAYALTARLAHAQADFTGARQAFAEAIARERSRGNEHAALRHELASTFVVYDQGDGDAAAALLDDTEARATVAGLVENLLPYLLGYRGNLARQSGRYALARERYAAAIDAARAIGDHAFARVFVMDDAIAALLAGDVDDGAARLAKVHAELVALPAGLWLAFTRSLVEHYAALAALLKGDAGHVELGDGLPSLQPVRDVVAEGMRTGAVLRALQALDARTEHARISATLLSRVTSFGGASRVIVARDGRRFIDGDHVVELQGRRPLRRILACLAAAHHHGAPVGVDSLITAGWPDERIQPQAARNRLHVALSALRKLGLEHALEHTTEGYRLSRRSVVVDS